jgi:hypothetical protein
MFREKFGMRGKIQVVGNDHLTGESVGTDRLLAFSRNRQPCRRPLLRLISSPACRGADRVPLAIVANMTGLSRQTLYRARDGRQVSADTAEVLTPLILQFGAGKLQFRRSGPRTRSEPLGDDRRVAGATWSGW